MDQNIPNRLYEKRKAFGFSQEELAEKLGVSRQAVSKWERGESSPDTENLIALATLYGISLDELVFGEKKARSEKKDEVKINFSGIHVNDKNGEKVDINWDGIHIDAKDSNIHIDKSDIKNGHIFSSDVSVSNTHRFFKKFPYPLFVIAAYLMFGAYGVCGGWALGWLVFLTIPLYYTLVSAIANKDPNHFAYPVLAVLIYLYLGLFESLWHPHWLIFLTIPIYYFLASFIKELIKKIS